MSSFCQLPKGRPEPRTHLVAVLILGVMVGCGSTQKVGQVPPPLMASAPESPAADRTKCNDRGKQIVTVDTNHDEKADVWKFFQTVERNGEKVEVLTCKEVDLNHDGKVDIVYYFDDKGLQTTLEEFDLDFDGKFDLTVYYVNGKKVREEADTDNDQRPDVFKFYEDEKLARIEKDTNGDGKIDEWQYFEAGRLDRIGYDTLGTGKVDRWDRAPESDEAQTR